MLTRRVWARYADLEDRDQRDLVKQALRGTGGALSLHPLPLSPLMTHRPWDLVKQA